MAGITLTEEQVKLLLSFAPKESAAELPEDLTILQRIDEIRKLVND